MIFHEVKKAKRGESGNASKIDKGITIDENGNKYGQIHTSMGDTSNLHLRNFDAFKDSRNVPEDPEEDMEEEEEFEEEGSIEEK